MSTSQPVPEIPSAGELIARSEPRAPLPWRWAVLGILAVLVYLTMRLDPADNAGQVMLGLFFSVSMVALLGLLLLSGRAMTRAHRAEVQQLQAIEEMIQLRRWPEAVELAIPLLSKPMRSQPARVQGLIFAVSLLNRYHRFDDAIEINDYLLQNFPLDPISQHGLRIGRAMAMLREDHLVDADRALSELRRESAGAPPAGLSLLELYRDIKTGHALEAVEVFNTRRDTFRQQLGHRFGDAFALVARAYDMLGQEQHASQHWHWATLLVPAGELARRYPEVSALTNRYPVAAAPEGGAA